VAIVSKLIGRKRKPLNRVAIIEKKYPMITLEKILTELKAESLNEIVAGKPGKGKGWGKGGNPNKSASASATSAGTVSVTTISTMSDTNS
jgi:hypothetical protein